MCVIYPSMLEENSVVFCLIGYSQQGHVGSKTVTPSMYKTCFTDTKVSALESEQS